jgi:5-methylcytosine-specific restriction enzyme subunit McrC
MELLIIREQKEGQQLLTLSHESKQLMTGARQSKSFYYKTDPLCFQLHLVNDIYNLDTAYFVGADWLVENEIALYVNPKQDDEEVQIDYIHMLFDSLDEPDNFRHLEGLFHIEYDQPWIKMDQESDFLSPILIVQFLKLMQRVVRKGLKKSYYRVTENLNSRVKGKILVGRQIKTNLVKNQVTKTICNYQEYGINTPENQLLKLVLKFISAYLNMKVQYFNATQREQLQHILNYCMPSFEHIDELQLKNKTLNVKRNVFYPEYEEVIRIGNYILRRFSFNISKVGEDNATTPPFWIDMSKLFELYVFGKLGKYFIAGDAITYHDKFDGGKETDILIRKGEYRCVIDCKYKPRYYDSTVDLADKRQLAGYTRLKKVYDLLGVAEDEIIKGLIIFSDQNSRDEINPSNLFDTPIDEYVKFYKLGIKLPEM